MKIVAFISSCKKQNRKIKNLSSPLDVYKQSTFVLSVQYCKMFNIPFYILSPKYGILTENDKILPYEFGCYSTFAFYVACKKDVHKVSEFTHGLVFGSVEFYDAVRMLFRDRKVEIINIFGNLGIITVNAFLKFLIKYKIEPEYLIKYYNEVFDVFEKYYLKPRISLKKNRKNFRKK